MFCLDYYTWQFIIVLKYAHGMLVLHTEEKENLMLRMKNKDPLCLAIGWIHGWYITSLMAKYIYVYRFMKLI